jgi:predicted nuclease of restriction endonuclease-like (RecB) superfamily
MDIKPDNIDYQNLVTRISTRYEQGQRLAVQAVNSNIIETYWHIGQYIVEFEQGGSAKAEYGKNLLSRLSKDLSLMHGKGFSLSNVYLMRQFFIRYPIFRTVSGKLDRLSWSHISELLPIEDPLERQFYEVQCIYEGWNVRELKRQKSHLCFCD